MDYGVRVKRTFGNPEPAKQAPRRSVAVRRLPEGDAGQVLRPCYRLLPSERAILLPFLTCAWPARDPTKSDRS